MKKLLIIGVAGLLVFSIMAFGLLDRVHGFLILCRAPATN